MSAPARRSLPLHVIEQQPNCPVTRVFVMRTNPWEVVDEFTGSDALIRAKAEADRLNASADHLQAEHLMMEAGHPPSED